MAGRFVNGTGKAVLEEAFCAEIQVMERVILLRINVTKCSG
jgi:hypothetical protein